MNQPRGALGSGNDDGGAGLGEEASTNAIHHIAPNGATVIFSSFSTRLPLEGARPGPPCGRLGSGNSSSRRPVNDVSLVFAVTV